MRSPVFAVGVLFLQAANRAHTLVLERPLHCTPVCADMLHTQAPHTPYTKQTGDAIGAAQAMRAPRLARAQNRSESTPLPRRGSGSPRRVPGGDSSHHREPLPCTLALRLRNKQVTRMRGAGHGRQAARAAWPGSAETDSSSADYPCRELTAQHGGTRRTSHSEDRRREEACPRGHKHQTQHRHTQCDPGRRHHCARGSLTKKIQKEILEHIISFNFMMIAILRSLAGLQITIGSRSTLPGVRSCVCDT